jgi:hypothetical protein
VAGVTKRGPSLGPDDKIAEIFRPPNWVTVQMMTDAITASAGTAGLNLAAVAALGTPRYVLAEAAPGGGWRWPIAGRPAWPAGLVIFRALGTGLARPAMDGSVNGGGGMVENDEFYF